jgi:hypothetical protein
VVLQLGGLALGQNPFTAKNKFVMDIQKKPQDLDGFFA